MEYKWVRGKLLHEVSGLKMTKIKIRSNPYNREISYLTMDEATGQWVDVRETDERSTHVLFMKGDPNSIHRRSIIIR